jgi:hypothetical protein
VLTDGTKSFIDLHVTPGEKRPLAPSVAPDASFAGGARRSIEDALDRHRRHGRPKLARNGEAETSETYPSLQ